jgi:HK97 family phage major capsid protein
MNKSKAMKNLLASLEAKQAEAQALSNKEDAPATDLEAVTAELKKISAKIELQKTLDEGKAFDDDGDEIKDRTPVNTPVFTTPRAGLRVFENLAEQLRAVKKFAMEGIVDERLNRLNNEVRNAAPLGANEGVGEEGGFAVQSDFAGFMMESAATSGQILPRVDRYEITSNANRVEWTDIDETSVATTVFGGVQVYWEGEGLGATAKQPKLAQKELKLVKLLGFAYATYELEQDSNFISQLYTRAFTLAIQRELEGCIISGTGAGKPLGFLKSASLSTITKETGQVADTIVWNNLSKMFNAAYDKRNPGYIWLCHPDTAEQFDFMQFPVGTGGVPVYLQEAKEGSLATLKGHAIVESDHCSAIGDAGDISYVNLKDYLLITKGGVQADTSMHVAFLTAQNCFRFIFRANGMPKKTSKLTIKNSSTQRSSFVTLGAR